MICSLNHFAESRNLLFSFNRMEQNLDGCPIQARFWLEWGHSDISPSLSSRPEQATARAVVAVFNFEAMGIFTGVSLCL